MNVPIHSFNPLSFLRKNLLVSGFICAFFYSYSGEVFSQTNEVRAEKSNVYKSDVLKVPSFIFDSKSWYLVGKATFTWGFWDIYDSALFTPSGQFVEASYQADTLSLLLLIEYQRNFSAKTLLDATAEQWTHLGIGEAKITYWKKAMVGSWPAIKKGDKLYYFYNGAKGQFFYQPKDKKPYLYSEITDKAQAKAFIAIWLSPHTAYPKQRAALIGQKNEY